MREDGKRCRFVSRLIFTGTLAFVIAFPSASQATKASPNIELGNGIVATVASLRSWERYDGQVPEKPYEYWRPAKGELIQPMPRYGQTSSLAGGTTSVLSNGVESYKATIKPFGPVNGKSGVKAAGRFVEIGLKIANAGDAIASIFLIDAAKSIIDADISDKKAKYPVAAFLIPGMDIYSRSMITVWGGGLGVDLGPGAATWILLVFDLPPEMKAAELRVLNSKPIKLSIPDWTKIEPSATYYTGDIAKGPDKSGQSGGSTFSNGTFSFWLSPDRTAIVKFSVALNDVQWLRNGETISSTGTRKDEFSDFTLSIENNKINASIPACYDILGAFTSPTQASGSINLHHFAVEASQTADLGTWEWNAAAAQE